MFQKHGKQPGQQVQIPRVSVNDPLAEEHTPADMTHSRKISSDCK